MNNVKNTKNPTNNYSCTSQLHVNTTATTENVDFFDTDTDNNNKIQNRNGNNLCQMSLDDIKERTIIKTQKNGLKSSQFINIQQQQQQQQTNLPPNNSGATSLLMPSSSISILSSKTTQQHMMIDSMIVSTTDLQQTDTTTTPANCAIVNAHLTKLSAMNSNQNNSQKYRLHHHHHQPSLHYPPRHNHNHSTQQQAGTAAAGAVTRNNHLHQSQAPNQASNATNLLFVSFSCRPAKNRFYMRIHFHLFRCSSYNFSFLSSSSSIIIIIID